MLIDFKFTQISKLLSNAYEMKLTVNCVRKAYKSKGDGALQVNIIQDIWSLQKSEKSSEPLARSQTFS